MKTFFSFVNKEVRHILRDRRTMLILFGMPLVMMLLFGFAISTDVRNVRLVAVTTPWDTAAQQIVAYSRPESRPRRGVFATFCRPSLRWRRTHTAYYRWHRPQHVEFASRLRLANHCPSPATG